MNNNQQYKSMIKTNALKKAKQRINRRIKKEPASNIWKDILQKDWPEGKDNCWKDGYLFLITGNDQAGSSVKPGAPRSKPAQGDPMPEIRILPGD